MEEVNTIKHETRKERNMSQQNGINAIHLEWDLWLPAVGGIGKPLIPVILDCRQNIGRKWSKWE